MKADKKQITFRMPMIELLIIVGVFAIVSVLIVRMFISTDRLQAKAVNISSSVMEVESIAELLKGSKSSEDLFQQIGAKQVDGMQNSYIIYYDKEWNQSKENIYNIILIEHVQESIVSGVLDTYQVIAYDKKNIESVKENEIALCDITVKKYRNILSE